MDDSRRKQNNSAQTPDTCPLCQTAITSTDLRTLRVAIPRNAHGYRYTEQGQPHYMCYQSVMWAETETSSYEAFFDNNPMFKVPVEKYY